MDLTERTLDSRIIYEGHIITLRLDTARMPDGASAPREVAHHPGGVAILPLDDDGNVTLVEQFRYPLGRVITEIPAGKLEPGEDPRKAALRELEEEVGLIPDTLTSLGEIWTSPGFCDETIYLYLATGLRPGTVHPDDDEFLRIRTLPLPELLRLINDNSLRDGKTVAAALKTAALLARGE